MSQLQTKALPAFLIASKWSCFEICTVSFLFVALLLSVVALYGPSHGLSTLEMLLSLPMHCFSIFGVIMSKGCQYVPLVGENL